MIALIQEHMRADHPDLVGTVSREDLEGWIQGGASAAAGAGQNPSVTPSRA